MMSKLLSLVAIASLFAAAALAAPAVEVPAVLAPRETACPTVSRWQSWYYTTVRLSTTTVTNGVSELGSVTSTKTEYPTWTVTTRETIFSPAVTTLPVTTITPVVAYESSTATYMIITETTTAPGYAPDSVCQVTTITNIIPSTTSVTVTQDLFYATTWTYQTGHVTTTTKQSLTTVTRTVTTPGSTTYATTITKPVTQTNWDWVVPTVTSTVYEKGCKSWACQG